MWTYVIRIAAMVLVTASLAPPAVFATTPVNTCGTTCTSSCYLNTPLSCTSGDGVTLQNGADFDMHGNSIACTSSSCHNAIVISSNSSHVTNSLSATAESQITGPWATGIACNNHTGTQVHDIAVMLSSSASTFIDDCAQVTGTRIIGGGASQTGIRIDSGTANTDDFSDNYIEGVTTGFFLAGTTFGVSVDHNLFVTVNGNSSTADPIYFSTTSASSIDVSNNVILGDATQADILIVGTPPPSSVFQRNYCDPSYSSCQTCISNGLCVVPVTPFIMP